MLWKQLFTFLCSITGTIAQFKTVFTLAEALHLLLHLPNLLLGLLYSHANAAREIIAAIWKTPRGFLCPGRKLPLTVLTEECIFIPTTSNSRHNLFDNTHCEPHSTVCVSQNTFRTMCWQKFQRQISMIIQNFAQIGVFLKNLIIYQTLGVGWCMKFILMRLVFPFNEKEDKQR